MHPEQKRVILQEIRHWRDSKLLPAEYCDFLMNLYAEGESFSAEQSYPEQGSGSRIKGSAKSILPGLGVLLVCLVVVFNFTWFPMPMQIGILAFASILPYFLARRHGRTQPFARVGWLAVAALLLVGDGYYFLWVNQLTEDTPSLLGVMAVVFFLWVFIGGIGRSRLIGSGGVAGLLLIYANLLEQSGTIGTATYSLLHLFWIFPAALLVFLSFLLGRNRVYLSPAFLFLGILAMFGPEVRMLMNATPMDLFVQGIVFLKLALLISLLIVFRLDLRRWMSQLSA
jgi:hypothetical protein